MSEINFTAIDAAYPVAGRDNDSQGFRDNFTAIATALSVAKAELTALETNSVLVATLDSNLPKVNDLLGSTIQNGIYTQFHGATRNAGEIVGLTDIDIIDGPLQIFTLTSNTTLRFNSWPDDTLYAKVIVHFLSDGNGTWTPTLATSNGGVVKLATGFPSLALNTNGKHKVIEAWSYNNGATVFVEYKGEY